MKNRGTYTLLALFFAGLVGLWVADFAQIPTRKMRERMSNRILHELLDTKPDDLLKIEILGGEQPLVFERRDGNRWQMTTPMNVAADPSMVETLAYNLKELTRKPEAATLEGNLERFGLAPPERTIRLWGSSTDESLASLEVGKVSLDRRYVRSTGSEGVEVVDARLLDLLKLLPSRWRDREIFRVSSLEVDAVNISSGGKVLELRRGRDAWRITAPFHVLAADPKVEGLIADLGTLKVLDDSRFVADDVKDADLERYGLKNPSMTIEVEAGRNGRRRGLQKLHVGKPVEGRDGQVYALREGQDDVVALDTRVLKDLKPEPNAFRSPKVADIIVPRVTRINVEGAEGETIEAVRSGNDWTIVRPSLARGDRQAIQNFLKSLDDLQTNTYPSPKVLGDSGLDKPSLVLKIWQVRDPRDPSASASADPNGELVVNLRIGRRDVARRSIYAQLEGDPTILALPDSANDFLPRNPLAFRDRQVLSEAVDQIERIKFIGEKRKFTLNAPALKFDPIGKGPLGWWMVEPVDAPADASSVGQLLRLLAGLRAESLVTEKADSLDSYGFKSPILTVTWSKIPQFSMLQKVLPPDQSPGTITLEDRSLIVGNAPPGRPNVRYAKLSDRSLVFTLGPDVLGVLDTEWRDHQVLGFDPKHVRKIQLRWPDQGFGLDSVQEGSRRKWALAGQADIVDFDPQQVATLIEAASKLTTNRFVQHQGDFPEGWGLTPPFLDVRFELDDGSKPRTLKLGAPDWRGQIFATTEAEANGAIFLLPQSLFASWLKAPRHHDDLPDEVFAR